MEKREIKEILEAALAQGGDFAEIYLEQKESTGISCEGGKIEKINTGIDLGIGIRVVANDNTSYAYTNNLDLANVLKIARVAGDGARSACQNPVLDFLAEPKVAPMAIEIRPDQVKLDDKVRQIKIADQAARELHEAIRQVSLSYSDIAQKVVIANSLGTYVEDERIRVRLSCNAIGQEQEEIQTGFASVGATKGFELFKAYDPQVLGQEAAERAMRLLGAKPCPGGQMPVVMASEAGGTMVHEACGHGLEGDLVQEGLSVYANKIGEQVASELVTVVDDATIAGKYGSYRYDDEGHRGQKNSLIKDGVLVQYMYDSQSARKAGCVSTGNGRRESYRDKPVTRMSNTYIASGKTPVDQIIASVDKGLFVTRMGGGQVNSINGDYVFDVAEGFLIEDGKVTQAIRGATLAGNGPQSLKMVEMVGDDLGYAIGVCGKKGQSAPVADAQPTMKINGLTVGGTSSGDAQLSHDFKIKRL